MNNLIKYLFLIFFIHQTSVSKAEIVKDIEINGNFRVSDETVKIYGKIILNQDYSEVELNKVLKNLYSTDFFENVTLDLQNNILKINLKEYPIVNQLVIVGEDKKSFRDQISKLMKLKEKRSFIKNYLSSDIDIIKNFYSSLGYNFSDVTAETKKIDENNLDLLIRISRGEQTKISSIEFIGNKKIRSKRLRDVIASEEDKFWKFISRNTNFSERLVNLDVRLLTNYYKSLGFYDVKIVSNIAEINEKGEAKLTFSVDEGQRYKIIKISTNVEKVFDKEIFFPINKEYKKYIGEYYSPFKIKKLLDELDEIIDDNNLQFVEHNVQEIIEKDGIEIVLNVVEGKKISIERINVRGNSITNEDVIRGELIIDEGDPFTQLALDKSISSMKARNIFKNVTYKVQNGSKENLKVIDIFVEEKPTGEVSAGAGIGSNGGTFAITIKENNWLGEGKKVAFDLQIDQESIAGIISQTDPNYNFLGNSLSYSIRSEKNDKPDQGYENSVYSASIGTVFEQYKDLNAFLGAEISYDDLTTVDTASDNLKKQSGSFEELSALYGFNIDKRDKPFKPSSGYIFKFDQTAPVYADKPSLDNTLSLSNYKTISEDLIGSSKIYLSAINSINSEDVRLSKRKGLSTFRLRGFERNKVGPIDGSEHIGGNYAAALNFDANLPNFFSDSSNADIGLFLDFGNVWGVDYDDTIDESNEIRSSTGVVINWMSPIGPFNFTLAQNLNKVSTDVTETFSFNLGTTF